MSLIRTVYPTLIADYDGISTAAISDGTSGALTPFPDANCLYYMLWCPNVRTTYVDEIIGPIRWQVDVPTTDGGAYDWWQDTASNYRREMAGSVLGQNTYGMCKALLPASGDSHLIPPSVLNAGARQTLAAGAAFAESMTVTSGAFDRPDFEAIIGGDLAYPLGTSTQGFWVQQQQVKHYVNGTLYNGSNPPVAGDDWYMDVWYLVKFIPSTLFSVNPLSPGRWAGLYWPYSRVDTGSANAGYRREMVFLDYECAGTRFDFGSHTYQLIAVGSHSWTFAGGTSGPELMATSGQWSYGSVSIPFGVKWYHSLSGSVPDLVSVTLRYGVEHALLTLEFKSAFATTNGINTKISYTPKADGNYLVSTTDTHTGDTLTHCDLGCFDQEFTTEFVRVDWDVNSADWDGETYDSYTYRKGNVAGTPSPSAEAPPKIFVTRKNIGSGITSVPFDSGSGNWTVPSGVTCVVIEGWGGGGGGGGGNNAGGGTAGSGGGGGGYFRKTIKVTPGDSIAYSVGAGGAAGIEGNPGTNGTAGGTTTIAGGTYTANGGAAGQTASTGTPAGGTASGGDTNTTGSSGGGAVSNVGGTGGGSPNGGATVAGTLPNASFVATGNAPGGGAPGGAGGVNGTNGGAGCSGRVKFSY